MVSLVDWLKDLSENYSVHRFDDVESGTFVAKVKRWCLFDESCKGENRMNELEETIRVIDAQIGYHKNQIKELNAAKKEVLEKYNIPNTL